MKKLLLLGLAAIVALASCKKDEESTSKAGYLQVVTSLNTSTTLKAGLDPNSFKLTISKKSDGSEVKSFSKVSEVGSSPIELAPDTYIVKTSSNNFTEASWDTPMYEATQEVTIDPAATKTVTLTNTQANAGVKMQYSAEFAAKYADYSTVIESAKGNLTYAKGETKVGYFAPGNITIKITAGGVAYPAKTIAVNARELVTLNVKLSDGGNGNLNLTVTVDNSVTERTEDILITPPTTPTGPTGVASLEENFESATAGVFALQDWTVVKNASTDIDWKIVSVTTPAANKYVEINSYKSGGAGTYENWIISPALDLDKAAYKNLNFETAKSLFNSASTLEVYILDNADLTKATKTKLTATVAGSTDVDAVFIKSGNVDLSAFSGVKYIAFKYVGTNTAATKYWIDNFRFGLQPLTPPVLGHGDTAADPLTVPEAITIQDNSVKWVDGYIVGTAVSVTGGGFTIKTTSFASGDNTNFVLAPSATETNPANCIAVQLPTGTLRTELNLYNNPTNVGKHIVIKGQVTGYFSRPGLKGVAEYQVK